MNKICKYCNKEIIIENSKQFGAHLTNCKLNPKTLERYKNRKIKKKDFNIICKCGTEFQVNITTESFEKNNYKKFCSRKCANSRVVSDEVKKKISDGVKKNNMYKGISSKSKNCKFCDASFIPNRKKQFLCSKKCSIEYRKKNQKNQKVLIKKFFKKKDIDIKTSTNYSYIYFLSFNDVPFYVGKTRYLSRRLSKHLLESKLERTKKEKYINQLISNGFEKEININILLYTNEEYIDYWEVYWIKKFKDCNIELLNSSKGGEGGDNWSGKKHSQETKDKVSESLKEYFKKTDKRTRIIGEKNPKSKLKESDVLDILLNKNKHSIKDITLKYNLSKTAIYDIIKRKSWKHL
jgi:hypothetical protein